MRNYYNPEYDRTYSEFSNPANDAYEFTYNNQNLEHKDHIKIMMIDDSPLDVELFRELLLIESNFHFSLKVWYKCSEAIEYLVTINESEGMEKPDLIVLDLSMPEMNGKIVLESLRKISNVNDIPIAIYSSQNEIANVKDVKRLAATAFFQKPLNVAEFKSFLGK